jgi:signal transduction histidine kinase
MNVSRFLDVPSMDPDDARRRKLLNILLAGVAALSLLVILAATIAAFTGLERELLFFLYGGGLAMLFSVAVVFAINRYWSGILAGSLFVLLFTLITAFSDDPQQVVDGRTLFVFAIPILMASAVVRPWASFAIAGVIGLLLAVIAASVQMLPNLIATLAFFAFALVSWLTARTLERALEDLRAINRELDQRVEERTQELTEANERLADANERLKELDRLKSRFLSMVSHDLRTPLNAILGFAEMLDAGVYGPLVEKQQGAVNRIVANVGRQMSLVNDLLDQARIEAGRLSLETTAFAPSDLIDGLVSEMGTLAQTKGLELSRHIVDNVPATLSGDPQRLHQILANLVGNAIKFTEQGGVRLRVYLPDETHWALEVSDTGPGIPKEAGDYIFDAFRQVDSSATRKHSGVGLGLSIVKQLTTLMGGEITLESEVGRGSTFTVVLPLVLVHE